MKGVKYGASIQYASSAMHASSVILRHIMLKFVHLTGRGLTGSPNKNSPSIDKLFVISYIHVLYISVW